MTRVFLATIPGGGIDLFVDSRLAEADQAALQAAEAAIAEARQRQPLEAGFENRLVAVDRKLDAADDIGD